MSYGNLSTIFPPPDIPTIQFATNELKQEIEQKGISYQLKPISEMLEKSPQMKFVVGLADDENLTQKLNAAGGKILEEMA